MKSGWVVADRPDRMPVSPRKREPVQTLMRVRSRAGFFFCCSVKALMRASGWDLVLRTFSDSPPTMTRMSISLRRVRASE
jgi:hypothetical protein